MLRLSCIWIFSQINTSIYTLEGEVNPKRFCCSFLRPPPVERINIKHMNVFCSIKLQKTNHRRHQDVTLHFICVIETSVESRKLDIGRVLFLLSNEPRHCPGPIKSASKNYFHHKNDYRFRLLHWVASKGEKKTVIYRICLFFR